MVTHPVLCRIRDAAFVIAALGWHQAALAQEAAGVPGLEGNAAQELVLRTYEVGDLVINIQDHPYSEALQRIQPSGGGMMGGGAGGGLGGGGGMFSVPDEAGRFGAAARGESRFQLAQMGGFGGGMGRAGAEQAATSPTASITVADILRVLTNTIEPNSWSVNGGEANVEPLGTTLVVSQTPEIHEKIRGLLTSLYDGSAGRKTVTIDARWLMLTSDELDSLLVKEQKDVPQVDRKRLDELTRWPDSIRGITNCLSSQLVYIVSGTMANVVTGFIPVVGSVDSGDEEQLADDQTGPQIVFVSDQSSQRSKGVGYQPIITNLNFGAVLEIRPTLVPGINNGTAMVDLKSIVTTGDASANRPQVPGAADPIAPSVDRVAIQTQEFATTLRVPLKTPILVGGLTENPSSTGTNAGVEPPAADAGAEAGGERRQRYLVLEVR